MYASFQHYSLTRHSAAITFTKEKLELKASGRFGKDETSFLQENETTVSVTWTGGGQDLKKRKLLTSKCFQEDKLT